MKVIRIKEVAKVLGDAVIDNKEIIEKYKIKHDITEQESKRVLEKLLGRDKRTTIGNDPFENTLTIGAKAVDKLIANLSKDVVENIGCIIFASQFPEFTCPSQALLIHNHLKAYNISTDCFTLDVNANCASGLYAMSVARSYMLSNQKKYSLVVAADYMTRTAQDGCLITEGCFGDAGVAVLLSLEEQESERDIGLTRAECMTTDESALHVLYPECGSSNIHSYVGDATKLSWENPKFTEATKGMGKCAKDLLLAYGLTTDDIKYVCPSQFTKATGELLAESLGCGKEKLIYVGDKYGYTGVSSPILSYIEGIEHRIINTGDLILFATIGLGGQAISMLYRV